MPFFQSFSPILQKSCKRAPHARVLCVCLCRQSNRRRRSCCAVNMPDPFVVLSSSGVFTAKCKESVCSVFVLPLDLCLLQCDLFIQEGARLGRTPAEVVSTCDITFACVSDPKAAKDVRISSYFTSLVKL